MDSWRYVILPLYLVGNQTIKRIKRWCGVSFQISTTSGEIWDPLVRKDAITETLLLSDHLAYDNTQTVHCADKKQELRWFIAGREPRRTEGDIIRWIKGKLQQSTWPESGFCNLPVLQKCPPKSAVATAPIHSVCPEEAAWPKPFLHTWFPHQVFCKPAGMVSSRAESENKPLYGGIATIHCCGFRKT